MITPDIVRVADLSVSRGIFISRIFSGHEKGAGLPTQCVTGGNRWHFLPAVPAAVCYVAKLSEVAILATLLTSFSKLVPP